MLVRLATLLRVMALLIALMTKRGLTPRQALVGRLRADARHVGRSETLDVLVGVELELLREIEALALRLLQPRQDREHGGEIDDVRVEVHLAERRRARHELAIDARLVAERERVRHLDDHHAIEQRLVLLLLQELVELGQVRVREDRLVEMNQRETRHLDVLLLSQRQEQVEKLALDLEDLDHLEHAAARGVDGARPGPGPRVALVADVGHLRQIDGAHEVRDVGRRRIVRRIRADADARRLGEEDALDGEAHEVALELVVEPHARVAATARLECRRRTWRGSAAASWPESGSAATRAAASPAARTARRRRYGCIPPSPRFSRITSEDLPPDGGPSSSSSLRPTSEPAAAALK